MNTMNIGSITVNGRRYALELLNPLDAFAWSNRSLELFGPAIGKIVANFDFDTISGLDLTKLEVSAVAQKLQGLIGSALASCGQLKSREVTDILTEAVKRCYTPKNERLADATVFNRHFREHPEDLYPLGIMALLHLVKDFFPKLPVIGQTPFQGLTPWATGEQSPSPMDGNPPHGPLGQSDPAHAATRT